MNEISLHRIAPQDVDAVVALARVAWQATYAALISQAQIEFMLNDRYAPARIRSQLGNPAHAWWGAQRGSALIGFAHAYCDQTDCKLDKLYVHPDQQRRGVGRMLLQAVQYWAREQRATRLWLQVNRGNTAAIRAYQKYGLKIVESRVFEIGHGFVMDDHVMEQTL